MWQISFSLNKYILFPFVGGQEWKKLAEKLGLAPREIRFLDNRVMNPCEAAIAFIASQRNITVRELYDTISECELPLVADILWGGHDTVKVQLTNTVKPRLIRTPH